MSVGHHAGRFANSIHPKSYPVRCRLAESSTASTRFMCDDPALLGYGRLELVGPSSAGA